MKPNKSKKIILIILIIVAILLLLSTLAYAYIATDIFKSNKQAFLKYAMQLISKEDGFIDKNLTSYFEKQKNTPYETKGNIKFDTSRTSNEKSLEYLKNMDITFEGKIDTANSKELQNISINYSNDVNFPINYSKTGKMVGLKTNYVGSKYLGIDTSKESDLDRNNWWNKQNKRTRKCQMDKRRTRNYKK